MAVYMKDKKSLYLLHNTLASVIKGMVGKYTVIDLRNESMVRGKVVEVDGYMNVELIDCIFCNQRGEVYPFTTFYVRSRNIRYVHMPAKCSSIQLMQSTSFQTKPKREVHKRRTFKESRAKRYQKEILDEIASKPSTSNK